MLAATPVLGGVVHPALRRHPPVAAGPRAGPGRRGEPACRSSSTPGCGPSSPAGSRPTPATVRAEVVLRATEGYTPRLEGLRRAVAPVYSLMVATEPLSDATWESIGLADRPTFSDGRHLIIYGQRTADGRLAFGGRGAPYHFGSRIRPSYDVEPRVFDDLRTVLREMLPQLRRRRVHPPVGRLPRHRPRLGRLGGARPRAPGSAGPAGTSATAWPPPTSPAAPWPTWSPGADSDLVTLPWVNHRSRSLGARAVALAGHQRRPAGDDPGRRRGAPDRAPERDRAADGTADRRPLSASTRPPHRPVSRRGGPRSAVSCDGVHGSGHAHVTSGFGGTVIKGERSEDGERQPGLPPPARRDASIDAGLEGDHRDAPASTAAAPTPAIAEVARHLRGGGGQAGQAARRTPGSCRSRRSPTRSSSASPGRRCSASPSRRARKPVAEALADIEEVVYVVITAGGFDILAEVVGESDAHLLELVTSRIRPIPGIVVDPHLPLPRAAEADLHVGRALGRSLLRPSRRRSRRRRTTCG